MSRDSYTVLAEHWDTLTRDVDYEKWADYVQWHLSRLPFPARRLAELGCGTGTLAALLARRGYSVTGVDLSPEMLSVAQQKCEGLSVNLICQDMSRLTLLKPVDAVICCLDSINYVTRPAALQRTFQRVYEQLRPGGLFLFDVKTPETLRAADGQMYLDETDGLLCVWRGEYSERRRIWGCGVDLFVRTDGGLWARSGEYHEEYAYTPEELACWLAGAGFPSVRQFGELKKRAPGPGEYRIFFAARKDGT